MQDTSTALTSTEREVFKEYARRRDFCLVYQLLDLDSLQEAESLFESARIKLLHRAYGEPDETWHTVSGLARALGAGSKWVAKAVKNYDHLGVSAIRYPANHLTTYYPPSVLISLRALRNAEYQTPDDGWLHLGQIHQRLAVDWYWARRRLKAYDHLGRPGINGSSKSSVYYPPAIVEALEQQRLEFEAIPKAGGYMTITQIARAINRSTIWTRRQLELIDFMPVQRKDSMDRVRGHYPPDAAALLAEIVNQYPPGEDWITATGAATQLGACKQWVRAQIAALSIEGELRVHRQSHHIRMHYPPSTVQRLLPLIETYPSADGWLTTTQLKTTLGWSFHRVAKALKELGHAGEMRLDRRNIGRKHYPPTVLAELRALPGNKPSTKSPV